VTSPIRPHPRHWPGKPKFAVADGKGTVFVNIEDTNELVAIDAVKAAVTKRYSLRPCEEPSGLAMDAKNRRLFSVCSNRLMAVSDPDSGRILATLAIGARADARGSMRKRAMYSARTGTER
jgi:hypothetical protein